ncbi:hypothetical protein [Acetobacter conturbans]|nr:hypothetical protein [Acetobacter conturbans]
MPESPEERPLLVAGGEAESLSAGLDGAPMPAVKVKVEAWLVEASGREKWITTDDPARYGGLGYSITPLVPQNEVPRAVSAAVTQVREEMLARHAADLRLLATIVKRLRTVLSEGYEYDDKKIRTDLVQWGLIEPASPARGQMIDTPEGRRLASVLELEWFLTKIKWATS